MAMRVAGVVVRASLLVGFAVSDPGLRGSRRESNVGEVQSEKQNQTSGVIASESPQEAAEEIGEVHAENLSTYSDFNEFSALSTTWRINPRAPFLLSPAVRIFDERPEEVSERPFHTHSTTIVSGDSSRDVGRQISASVGVEGSYRAFDGAVQASLEAVSSKQVKTYRRTQSTLFRSFKISSDVPDPHRRLNVAWKYFLLEKPVESIHHRLGDFVATEVTYGGALQVTTTASMAEGDSKSSVEMELNANFNGIFARASASISAGGSSSYKSSEHEFQSKSSTFGGDATLWAQLTDDNFADVQQQWADSITRENQFEVEFRLFPIWRLLDHDDMDKDKAQELRQYMLNKWRSASVQIPDYAPEPSASSIQPDFESRPRSLGFSDCAIYRDRLPGSALRGGSHSVVMFLEFKDSAATAKKRQWIFNLGQEGKMAHHWLYNPNPVQSANHGHIQFGTWGPVAGGGQIKEGRIQGATTLATTYDGDTKTYSLYIDGVLSSSQHFDLDIRSGAMLIGDRGHVASNINFEGCVKGVDVYRTALSASQVQAAVRRLK